MADKHKSYSPEVVTKEMVFEAAKALEPEEEGCSFNFIVLDISVECIYLVKTSVNLVG